MIIFAKKNRVSFRETGQISESIVLQDFDHHRQNTNRNLNTKEKLLLADLCKRKRLEYPNLFMKTHQLIDPQINKSDNEKLKNDVSKQFDFNEAAWEKIMKFLKTIADRFDLKSLLENQETNVFFDKLINAFLMNHFTIDLKNEDWQREIKVFGEKWGFNEAIIRTINTKTIKDDPEINFQSACSGKLNYIQTEILKNDKKKWPYCLLVRIFFKEGGPVERFAGTGFFIDNHHLMTALHLFYGKQHKRRLDNSEFKIGIMMTENQKCLNPSHQNATLFFFLRS